jgi:hypothetical protein
MKPLACLPYTVRLPRHPYYPVHLRAAAECVLELERIIRLWLPVEGDAALKCKPRDIVSYFVQAEQRYHLLERLRNPDRQPFRRERCMDVGLMDCTSPAPETFWVLMDALDDLCEWYGWQANSNKSPEDNVWRYPVVPTDADVAGWLRPVPVGLLNRLRAAGEELRGVPDFVVPSFQDEPAVAESQPAPATSLVIPSPPPDPKVTPKLELIPGAYVYRPGGDPAREVVEDLQGKPLEVLNVLVSSRHYRARMNTIIDAVWAGPHNAEDYLVKGAVSKIRESLKRAMRRARVKNPPDDPVPCVDTGRNLAWKIDLP